jgi:hypothetical protein
MNPGSRRPTYVSGWNFPQANTLINGSGGIGWGLPARGRARRSEIHSAESSQQWVTAPHFNASEALWSASHEGVRNMLLVVFANRPLCDSERGRPRDSPAVH